MGWQSNNTFPLLFITTQTGTPTGLFVYDPSVGLGNLLASITASTTDPVGNPTVPGITLYDSSGNPRIEVVTGAEPYLQLLNPSGAVIGLLSNRLDALTWYEDTGTATQGAIVASIAGKAGTDSYGNAFPLGAEIFKGQFDGTNYIFNADGAFFYSGTPSSGNLIASIASVSGTDAYGNDYIGGDGSAIAAYSVLGTTVLSGSGITFYTYSGGNWNTGSSFYSDTTGRMWMMAQGSLTDPPIIAGTQIVATEPGIAPPRAETTHALGPLGVTGLDITTANYYRQADGKTFISIKGSATASVASGNAAFPNSLPADYRPATATELPVAQGGSQVAGDNLPHCYVKTDGQIALYWSAMGSGSGISVQAAFDLQ